MEEINYSDFQKVEMRAGTVARVEDFPEAKVPAFKLWVDFGDEIGTKKSSSQITDLYKKEDLVGRQVIAVVNFPPKQVGPFMSECLVLGFYNEEGKVVLATPDKGLQNGARLA